MNGSATALKSFPAPVHKRRNLVPGLTFLVTLACIVAAHGQVLDLNNNGASDVWELVHGAETLDLHLDADGDGVSNGQEALAGTNPFDVNSLPWISSSGATEGGFRVSMAGALGKRYQLQASEVLCGPNGTNWFNAAHLIARNDPSVILMASRDLPIKFFRVLVSDVDTDGDGLSDWEEYQLGLNPLSAASNGQLDENGKALSDFRHAANRLKLQPGTAHAASGTAAKATLAVYPKAMLSGTGLTAQYFTNASSTYASTNNFRPQNLILTRDDPGIDFTWGPPMTPNLSNGVFSVRWTGQVEPQYSERYFFETRTDDGVKLWVNDQLLIDRWSSAGTFTGSIDLEADIRYNIRFEYCNRGGRANARLSWYSASQARQVIPALRLYPSSGGTAPGGVTSPLTAVAFLGQPFHYPITGANTPLGFEATNIPPGLTFNATNGVIDGVPSLAGNFPVYIAVSNSAGIAGATLQLQVIDTGSSVTREVWLGVTGTSVNNIPLHLPPSAVSSLGTLEGLTDFGDNYGERVRGYLVAPATGNYYFWISGNSAAELWISNDQEPANKVKRAFVSNPKPTTPRQWTLQPNQRTPWLALEAGKRYFVEILHKAGKGANDHWSVGWLQDPSGTNTVPSEVVPGFVLAPYVETPPSEIPGTLYSANMLAQSGTISPGVGSATLRLSADERQAVLRYSHTALSAPVTAKHIHADTYLGKNPQGQIIFDIDTATPQPDGSYVWDIIPSGSLSAADIVEIVKQGKSYINVHSVTYPAGEINGHFGLANGTATFTPPPPAPAWIADHKTANGAARFLQQATFGASPAEIKAVQKLGYENWINKQLKMRPTSHLNNVYATAGADPNSMFPATLTFNTWWKHSVTAPDQLRQRVAFALSQIMVVSEEGVLDENPRAISSYYDMLLQNAFGNFRELIEATTLHPAMGIYLDMRRNDKGDLAAGRHPNENYAREILQLFSIGLNRMWPDGTLVLSSAGDVVPTYNQDIIIGFSRVFTGWNYWQPNQENGRLPVNWNPGANYIQPMVLVPTHHELGTKRLLDNVILPPATGAEASMTNAAFDLYCTRDLQLALDNIFYNENVGPFICRQLIQRLVTSHPSRDYLYRVVQKFNDNGDGVRGDMAGVIKAILLDYEARSPVMLSTPTYGKQREPLLRATAIARALAAPAPLKGKFRQNGSSRITVTTSKPHRLSSSDDVFLSFAGKSGPASQVYNNVSVSNANTFTVVIPGISFGTYTQSGTTITVTNSGHGLSVGDQIHLTTTSGGLPAGTYTVSAVTSASIFTLNAANSAGRAGTCAFPKFTGGGFTQSGTTITLTTTAPHGMKAGNNVYLNLPDGSDSPDGAYRVASVPAPNRFTVTSTVSGNDGQSSPLVLPLIPAAVNRSGSVTVQYSTWQIGSTDSGNSSSLLQTPLAAPTVFNYFFPDYKFQGILASAGLTTPEFQLTSDTSVILQMNFVTSALFNNAGNTNGLSSFNGGNGAIMLDIGPWMTPTLTSNEGIPQLVDALNTLLCGGQLSAGAKNIIVSYVANNTNFPYTTPTNTQMRDRIRAVIHQIVSSPDFIVQR
jgi:uncharacterized protein (DUF1800 family)